MGRIASSVPAGTAFFKDRAPVEGRKYRGLKRASLRDSFIRKLKKEGARVSWNRNGKIKRQKPLKKISRSQRKKLAVYIPLKQEWLAQPENRNCQCCIRRREAGENILLNPSSECHHSRGRNAALMNDVRFWIPTCFDCGRWIHQHPVKARELRLLASAAEWNTVPDDGK